MLFYRAHLRVYYLSLPSRKIDADYIIPWKGLVVSVAGLKDTLFRMIFAYIVRVGALSYTMGIKYFYCLG